MNAPKGDPHSGPPFLRLPLPLSKICYIFAKNVIHMNSVAERKSPSIQTAFRIPEELLSRVKREAKRRGTSVNAYVLEVLDRETRVEWPKLPKDYKVSQEILDLQCVKEWKEPTEEELREDPRMAAILGY